MGAVEAADPEVHDARACTDAAVVCRPGHPGRQSRVERGLDRARAAASSLDRAHRQALDQLVLGGEAGDEHRQRDDERRRAHLGQEQALAGDEAGEEDRRGLRDGRR